MAERRSIGNIIGPARFLAFLFILLAGAAFALRAIDETPLALMTGFDVAALMFLASCVPLLGTRDPADIEQHAASNDANRTLLLAITGIVVAVLLLSIAAETVGRRPEPGTKIIIIATLVLAWLFTNSVYALHYAHLAYARGKDSMGINFPDTPRPVYWDFVYFAFTLGMTFQTSDVTVGDEHIRRVVAVHCLAAFFFNIGVLAFTINVLGSA